MGNNQAESSESGQAEPPEAGASARSRHRALAAEFRFERTAVGVVLATAVGVMVAGIAVWWVGAAAAGAVFAGHAVYVWVRPGPLADWRRGARAERRTGRRLSELVPASGFRILHDRRLPGARGRNLDHLVIGLTGVYVIVSRGWRPGVAVREEQGRLLVGRRPLNEPIGVAVKAAGIVGELLADGLGAPVEVGSIVAVHRARVPRDGIRLQGVLVLSARELARVLSGRPVIYTTAQVDAIAAVAERSLPPMRRQLSLK
ncbi:nuclease-related domain-containing protein [Actinomadura rupiterrae]|uniref:nuclease-related domain-containing protein n=1 Tax=Actinomadura rupiterrae TaxID=559627 RepID=UPI0020A60952|nr:nuclease-related domain-containing protein [Actinomadura rupiterrae]MCP2342902.1 hypothetical protein [Actinomadura rupiterrae]